VRHCEEALRKELALLLFVCRLRRFAGETVDTNGLLSPERIRSRAPRGPHGSARQALSNENEGCCGPGLDLGSPHWVLTAQVLPRASKCKDPTRCPLWPSSQLEQHRGWTWAVCPLWPSQRGPYVPSGLAIEDHLSPLAKRSSGSAKVAGWTWAVRIRNLHGFPLSPRRGAGAAADEDGSKRPPAAAAVSIARTVANSRSRTKTWRGVAGRAASSQGLSDCGKGPKSGGVLREGAEIVGAGGRNGPGGMTERSTRLSATRVRRSREELWRDSSARSLGTTKQARRRSP
jgi:hypothetical protein